MSLCTCTNTCTNTWLWLSRGLCEWHLSFSWQQCGLQRSFVNPGLKGVVIPSHQVDRFSGEQTVISRPIALQILRLKAIFSLKVICRFQAHFQADSSGDLQLSGHFQNNNLQVAGYFQGDDLQAYFQADPFWSE